MSSAIRHDLNALLGSRICHDLISPLGAIGNGVELLAMSGITGAPEIALISESVENANARIRFFRVAFGAASSGQQIGRGEVAAILRDMTKGGRLEIDWQPKDDLPRADVKLAFLLLQCLETSMPWGGRITVVIDKAGWHVLGAAEKMKIDPALWDIVIDPNATLELTSAHVHFALVPDAARRAGRSVAIELKDAAVAARF
ncbi:MAG: histidine phosphotransferase family protein [Pseudomonadota bacterium]